VSFLYQIEKRQAALVAKHEAIRNPPQPPANLGVPLDPDLNAQIEALIEKGVSVSKNMLVTDALKAYLSITGAREIGRGPRQKQKQPVTESKKITVGVLLDSDLNTQLTDYCKRMGLYKKHVALLALAHFVGMRQALLVSP